MDFFGPRFEGRRYLRYFELVELGIVTNRGTLKNLIDRGAIPPPVRLGGRTMLFDTAELVAALGQRAAPSAARRPTSSRTIRENDHSNPTPKTWHDGRGRARNSLPNSRVDPP
jgi:predicted DNA-binding transcriptional regulator AlpA